jgi:hypothetical protein
MNEPYWLCCGSKNYIHHRDGCCEAAIGNIHHCRWGTAEEHSAWQTNNNRVTDRELIVFLMDEIDDASDWLVQGQTHMATGVLGRCHAEIRKHLSKG